MDDGEDSCDQDEDISENDELYMVDELGPLKVGGYRRGSVISEIFPNMDKFTVSTTRNGISSTRHLSISEELGPDYSRFL